MTGMCLFKATCEQKTTRIAELEAQISELKEAIKAMTGHNLPTSYESEDDEYGGCPYCGELSFEPHSKTCEAYMAEKLVED